MWSTWVTAPFQGVQPCFMQNPPVRGKKGVTTDSMWNRSIYRVVKVNCITTKTVNSSRQGLFFLLFCAVILRASKHGHITHNNQYIYCHCFHCISFPSSRIPPTRPVPVLLQLHILKICSIMTKLRFSSILGKLGSSPKTQSYPSTSSFQWGLSCNKTTCLEHWNARWTWAKKEAI